MSTHIHPSAVVDPGAELGSDVFVGPFCVVEKGVVIGAGCWLQSHVVVASGTRMGERNRFFSFGSIGQVTQDLKYVGEPTGLEIGSGNTFREFVTIHRGTAPGSYTRVGDGGNFLSYSHIAHDCQVGNHVIFSNNGTLAGHVEVGDHAVIGGFTAVHQFCRIGRHALTGGCSKIVQDVPPYMIADGNPASVRSFNKVGLERHGFSEAAMRQIKDAYRLIYRSKLNLQQAVEQIRADLPESPEVEHLVDFVTHSPRGIIK